MEFRVLGPLELVSDEGALGLGGSKQRAVLAVLTLRANQVVSTDHLVDALWGNAVPESAIGVLRTYVSRLRRVLRLAGAGEAQLLARPPGYVLEVDAGLIDARRFEGLVGEARRARDAGRPDVAATTLRRALDLWRGDVLADLADLDAVRPAAASLEQMRLAAIEDCIDARLSLGEHADVIADLESLATEHPFRERLWSQLIVARYRLGRQTDALDAYQSMRSTLLDEAGLDPGPELQSLERQLLDHADELRWQPPDGAALDGGGPGRATGALPPRLTRCFGREAELAELSRLVGQARMVTLVGAPGCGKTRLAVELGARFALTLPGGVWFTELALVGDPQSVAGAIGATVGLREQPGRPVVDTLVDALAAAEPCLMVLDDCEHVVEAVGALAHRLVAGCRSVRVLATSRAALGVPGERVWRVRPLDLEAAVQLFADRATLASSGFRLDADREATVAGICAGLDCLPLAVELSAAWTRVLSPGQIADRLDSALPLLTGGGHGRGPRHETMEAAVDWSYRLLPPGAQRMFERLSVCAGGFDLEAVEAVAGPGEGDHVLNDLAALVDHSLVVADTAPDGAMRYGMPEPVRQCGDALLTTRDGDGHPVRRRHAEHYLALARRFDPWGLRGVDHPVPADRLAQEEGNLLAALSWAAAHGPDLALALGVALAPFWELGGPVDRARSWMERLLAPGTSDHQLHAHALAWAGRLAWRQGDGADARRRLDESLALAREIDDPAGEAMARRALATVVLSDGRPEEAVQLGRASLALCHAVDDRIGVAWSRQTLGWARYVQGDAARGDREMRAALAANQAAGNAAVAAHACLGLHYGAFLAGDGPAQRIHLVGALEAARDRDAVLDESDVLWHGAILAVTERRFDAALRLVGGARAPQRSGSRRPAAVTARFSAALDPLRDTVGDADHDRLVAEGQHLSWDALCHQAIAAPGDDRSAV